MSKELTKRMAVELAGRQEAGLLRTLQARPAESTVIDLSNNDYLRLSRHPRVVAAAQSALEHWGASASASPLITGYTELHRELATRLAEWSGFKYCLVWNTGYAANQAVLACLPQKGDRVLADRLLHNSMISGILRSGARLTRYRHLDLEHLESLLTQQSDSDGQVFVVTETVFSMDGDYPDLKAMAELKARYGFCWIVDEAHAIGWYGQRGSGMVEAAGVGDAVDVLVGTLGKGLGSMGAFTLFHQSTLRDYLVNFAGELIYSTYLAPASAAAALAAVDLAEEMAPERPGWQAMSRALRAELGAAEGESSIIPVPMSGTAAAMEASAHLLERGFRVAAVRPPTVPEGTSRLRISLNRALGQGQRKQLVKALGEACR